MRLLVIEDPTPLRNAVGQYLREAGFMVDTAAAAAAMENPLTKFSSSHW